MRGLLTFKLACNKIEVGSIKLMKSFQNTQNLISRFLVSFCVFSEGTYCLNTSKEPFLNWSGFLLFILHWTANPRSPKQCNLICSLNGVWRSIAVGWLRRTVCGGIPSCISLRLICTYGYIVKVSGGLMKYQFLFKDTTILITWNSDMESLKKYRSA